MNKKAIVYNNGIECGILEKTEDEYIFYYNDYYYSDKNRKAISLTLPKSKKIFKSKVLFPFFFGLLSEGIQKEMQCRLFKIDENDHFTRLLKTAENDTIGSVTLREIE